MKITVKSLYVMFRIAAHILVLNPGMALAHETDWVGFEADQGVKQEYCETKDTINQIDGCFYFV